MTETPAHELHLQDPTPPDVPPQATPEPESAHAAEPESVPEATSATEPGPEPHLQDPTPPDVAPQAAPEPEPESAPALETAASPEVPREPEAVRVDEAPAEAPDESASTGESAVTPAPAAEPDAEPDTTSTPESAAEPEQTAVPEPETAEPESVPEPAVAPTPTPAAVPHAPHPGPPRRPGPRSKAPTAAPVTIPAEPASDPAEWGRVADDGTVYVRTADGERAVGSYPGAEAPEALAYFGRKYDELAGQIALLEQRVRAGGVSPQDATTTASHLRDTVAEAHAVGDLAALDARLDALGVLVEERKRKAEAKRTRIRAEATAAKERIAGEAEALAESNDWKKTGDRLRDLLEEWKKAPRLDRKADDALWKRFSTARTAFDRRRRVHFAELDGQRDEAAGVKEKLIKKAEALSTSTEWGDTAKAYRDLMNEWKTAGRARRDIEDALWERFRAAQDVFFSARSAIFSTRDAEQAENLAKKKVLAAEAEALLPVGDRKSARAVLRDIHDRWEAIGHVPRGDRDAVENRLKKVEDAVRGAEDAEWKRSNPEARARAEATVAQLRTSIEKLEREASTARAAGQEKKAADAEAGVEARRSWLVEAEKTLAEFS